MHLNLAFKSSCIALAFAIGITAWAFVLYGILGVLFEEPKIFATVFGGGWASQSYWIYRQHDRRRSDRPGILVGLEKEKRF